MSTNVTANDIVSINGNTTLTLAQKQVFLDYVQGWSKSNISSGIASSAVGVINNATGVGSSAVGFNNTASATNSSVFGSYSKATHTGATALGNDSETDRDNSISVGKAGAEKQITNVKAGTADTDAINKKQLDSEVLTLNTRIDNLPTGGSTPIASDNYAHTSTDTALGSAKGTPHATTTTTGKITAVGGITVTTDLATAGISIDDINSFTVGGVITTKAADPAKVAAFINAAKKGGNIAVGQLSSAVGTANIASGNNSSALGSNNTASSNNSSALGYGNTASNLYSNALGYRNTASNLYSNALGFNNDALGWSSSSVGLGNLTTQFASSAFGFFNAAVAESSTAMGSGISGGVSSRLRTLEEKVENGKLVSVNGVAVTATGNTTATITHVNGVAVDENQKSQFLNILRQGNVAAGQYSSAMGVRNLATGVDSSAFGYGNDASGVNSSAVGFENTASNGDLNNAFGAYNKNNGAAKNTAVGIGNIINSSAWGTNALGYSNNVSNLYGSAIGTKNTVTVVGGNAIGLNNIVTGGYANAIGTGNTVIGQNGAAVGSGLADYAGNLGPQVVLTPFSYTPTFSSVGGVTTLDGVVIKTSAADWAALSANPSLLTEVNGQSVTAAQATDIINNFKQGGNLALSSRSSVFGINSKAVAAGATAIGLNSVADEANTISVGRAGAEKRITNVATGTADTDAINKKQLTDALAAIPNATPSDNYARASSSTALGSAKGSPHTIITTISGKITAVGGIAVTTTGAGTTLDDIDSFTVNSLTTTKAADPVKFATFINAIKKGGNLAMDGQASALGTGNIASGLYSNAVGNSNTASSGYSTAVGYMNTASGSNSSAVGYVNIASGWYSSAVGYRNEASGLGSNAVGGNNLAKSQASNAFGITNTVDHGASNTNPFISDNSSRTTANAFGSVNNVTGAGATAVGLKNTASGVVSSAFGTGATANRTGSIAFGGWYDQNADNEIDDASLTASETAAATGVSSVAIGAGVTATADRSSVFGVGSQATALNATAIGFDSLADEANTVSVGRAGAEKRITNVKAGTADTDAVNKQQLDTALTNFTGNADTVLYDTGSNKATLTLAGANGTKITNLQDATLDATSKDAVTGKQLHATNTALVQALGGGAAWNNGLFTNPTFTIQGQAKNTVSDAFIAVDQQLGAIKTSVSDLDQQAVSNLNDAKNYTDQQTTTALNNAKGYTDQKTTSTLNDAKSYADQKAADGKAYTDQQTASTLNSAKNYTDQKAADGKAYTDQQTASVLNDAKSYTDQKAASSLSGAKDYTDQQTASALSSANSYTDGKIADVQTQLTASNQFVQVNGVTDAQDASATGENSVAIGTNTVVTGHRSTAVGVGNQVSGNGSGAFGDPNTVSGNGSYVVGNDNKVTGDHTFVLGNNVDTQAKNAVVLGNDSASDRDNTVSVGAKGKERQIIHVADAVEDTDAVNYQQLKAAEKSTNNYTNERVNALNSAFNDYRMETEQRFHKVDERFNRQGAMTAAMMNMSSSAASVKGQNRVGVGAGFQGQEQAVSIGYQRIINDNTSLTIGGAFTKEESSGGVGVGFGW